jgi:hypothetical protein
MNLALFKIDTSPSSDRGFDVDPSDTPDLQIESLSPLVWRVQFKVKSGTNTVRATAGAPTLTLDNSSETGQEIEPLTLDGTVEISAGIPGSRAPHLWEVQCVVNSGGEGGVDPDCYFSRFIAMRSTAGYRKIMQLERDEYDPIESWAGAINEMVDGI